MISSATRPQRKSSPKTFLTLAISACAEIIFGFGVEVLERFYGIGSFAQLSRVEKALHASCIAVVPILKASAKALSPMPSRPSADNPASSLVGKKGLVCRLMVKIPAHEFLDMTTMCFGGVSIRHLAVCRNDAGN